jgi:tetratricopeptide (TPR) repeat protein
MPGAEVGDDLTFRRRIERLDAALASGRQEEAVRLARALPGAGGRDQLAALQVAAAVLQHAGGFDEAIALQQRAVRLAPRDAQVRAGLAERLSAARRPEAALQAWDEALELAPGAASVMSGKARLLHDLGRVDEASSLFRDALAAEPDCFMAHLGLALLALEAGRLEEASSLAAGLRAREPERSDVRWLAAKVALGLGDLEAARTGLEALLHNGRLTPTQRAEALLLLGQALDGLGLAPQAFAAAVEGKAIQRRLYAERAAGREAETDKLHRLAAWFSRADPAGWGPAPRLARGIGHEAARHVFLVGFPRSGTTLLEQALAGHPQVVSLEEAPTLAAHYAEFLSSAAGCESLQRLAGEEADHWRARYWAEVHAHRVDTHERLFLDKAPGGTLTLPLIAKLFPRARIIFALRDPRDVVLSCLRNAFQMNALTYAFTTLEGAAACYGACMAMAEVYRALLPLDLIEVRHERLVEDFDGELARIADFVGIEFHPAMADVAGTAARRSVRTPSAPQVRAGLNRAGVGRWRAYARELEPVRATLTLWTRKFGYPPE